jgi:hypothetical protein
MQMSDAQLAVLLSKLGPISGDARKSEGARKAAAAGSKRAAADAVDLTSDAGAEEAAPPRTGPAASHKYIDERVTAAITAAMCKFTGAQIAKEPQPRSDIIKNVLASLPADVRLQLLLPNPLIHKPPVEMEAPAVFDTILNHPRHATDPVMAQYKTRVMAVRTRIANAGVPQAWVQAGGKAEDYMPAVDRALSDVVSEHVTAELASREAVAAQAARGMAFSGDGPLHTTA